jgi:mandelate racemase
MRRPVVSKVGLFDQWPIILIDIETEEGVVGRSYLEQNNSATQSSTAPVRV